MERIRFLMSFENDVSIPVFDVFFSIIQIEAIIINRLDDISTHDVSNVFCFLLFTIY